MENNNFGLLIDIVNDLESKEYSRTGTNFTEEIIEHLINDPAFIALKKFAKEQIEVMRSMNIDISQLEDFKREWESTVTNKIDFKITNK